MSTISLIAAVADNGAIGYKGSIPWRIPEDLRRFKSLTMGKPCIMGRKTWDSLPKKPLPGRTNIVVTRSEEFHAEGAVVVHSLDEAIDRANKEHPQEIMVIGGGEIYGAALPIAQRIYLTRVHENQPGDVYIGLGRGHDWRETGREDHQTPDGLRYSYVTLERDLRGGAARIA